MEEFASLEALDNGKPYSLAKFDIDQVAESLEYFAGQADKIAGKKDKSIYSKNQSINQPDLMPRLKR